MLKDSRQRSLAIDPTQSFIVQAPAGSGKTEILTQRFLRLLSTVNAPEQIIALTFTRKAASEMRERILRAIQQVADNIPPQSPHQQQTFALAGAALQHDKTLGWQLLKHPQRLRIMTIDALCQSITQAIPLPEKQFPYATITEQPQRYYEQAARACTEHALADESLNPCLTILLQHLDNRQDRLYELLSGLLEKRDQWLEILFSAKTQDRAGYEQGLALIEAHALQRLIRSIPSELADELCRLCQQLAQAESNPHSPRYPLHEWYSFEQMNNHQAAALAGVLLKSDHQLRQGFDHHVGLQKSTVDAVLYRELKERSKALLEALQDFPDFREALVRVANLPPPQYDREQWEVLQALMTLLPLLAAHLQLLFKEANACDFTAITEQSLLALGDEDNPTDLTLHLDNAIHHLLVDEFQDTSIQQYRLLEKLTQGWQPDEGKTLFLVGDPMQSIYRFRQAEVGLFIKAKHQGIGAIKLTPLELSCNFRSSATLVNWVNARFQSIFPALDDMESGAVSFHPSTSVHAAGEDSTITAWQCANREQEANTLLQLIEHERSVYPDADIAILVRSRSQLKEIVSLLSRKNIPFQGVEIQQLTALPHIQDIASLTKALLYPADRIAWLALLRSPWCGLPIADLYHLANHDRKKSIYYALQHLHELPQLSEEGLLRARFVSQVLTDALENRHQQSLVDWIRATAKRLHADRLLNDNQRKDLEQFWCLLESHSEQGQLVDMGRFKTAMKQLYSEQASPSRLQIMTIHKSKGLEFDSVILPGLGSKAVNSDQPLLRWLTLPSEPKNLVLLSPLRAAYKKECRLYNYLAYLDAEKDDYELQRLLYVAATRAKKRLHLLDNQENDSRKSTFRALLKAQAFNVQEDESPRESVVKPPPALTRLPRHYYEQAAPEEKKERNEIQFPETSSHARQLGIAAHELLQWVCTAHPQTMDELPWVYMENQLLLSGLTKEQCQDALDRLRQQIRLVFEEDTIAHWICKAHTGEKNEYELLAREQGRIRTYILDRTFIADGCRWIIDFKTGSDDDLAREAHRKQVNTYASLLLQEEKRPIRCGVYYLASGHWLNWDFQPQPLPA
ncbi:UvrD-helicase domain-containing protein [Legionella taurinensis]|uniref:DNA 3'-5' helicase n=1 Tax=Legionella taurinensis TaxID=70611 RepID=A0A3A5LCK6_9GAMM|nr:UvrD-helicase domain-containing protein [Legionella taurinensis]RJT49351.1 ATP-dependent DNA helicase [Legionella taurinensis]RJT69384.1 ATP-dependent DNA helicase [Legionella taurinensis]STY26751.1 ATP-dependent DNA helicase (UvrD/Rep helicase) [Legionella taurinensis]